MIGIALHAEVCGRPTTVVRGSAAGEVRAE